MKTFCTAVAAAAATASVAGGAHATNLLTNGSFETGDLTGWTTINLNDTRPEASPFDGYAAEDGSYLLAMGNVGVDGTISQTVSDTAGQTLQVSYWYAGNGTASDFQADWNGVAIPGSTLVDADTNYNYVHYVFDVKATGSDTLSFVEQDPPSWNALDNVSLSAAVPEPGQWALTLLGLGLIGAALRGYARLNKELNGLQA